LGKGATGLTGIYRRRIPINRGNHRVYGKGLSKTLATDYKTGDFRERAERAGTACRRQASRGPVFCRGLTAAPVSPPGVIHLGGTINRSRCLHLGRKQGARENQAEAYALKLGERIKKRETLIENALYRWNTAKKRA